MNGYDGALWIWERLPALHKTLKLSGQNVYFLIDFYHAVEHLNKVASLRKDWSPKIRKTWLNKQRRTLHEGGVDHVIEAIQKLCRGRNSKTIRTQLNYFIKHRLHMNYALIAKKRLPTVAAGPSKAPSAELSTCGSKVPLYSGVNPMPKLCCCFRLSANLAAGHRSNP